MVSIITITYNHVKYIADTIEGVLMQEVNFPIEFIIADDCSSDETENVVLSFIENHPRGHWIKYTKHKINKGMNQNFVWALSQCKGKYIALCEGDDYWTDPVKLQKQVDFLEENKDCVLCHHWHKLGVAKGSQYNVISAPKEGHGYFPNKKSDVSRLFSNQLRVKTRSVLFRNVINPNDLLAKFPNAAFGDVPLSFLLGKKGKFGFIDKEMAVYRVTNKGASMKGMNELGEKQFQIEHLKNWIRIWDQADKLYDYKYKNISIKSVRFFFSIMPVSLKEVVDIVKFNQINRDYPTIDKTINSFWFLMNFFIGAMKRKVIRLFN